MPEPYQHERDTAIAAVRKAARICQSVQAAITPDVLEKKDRSPVTVADFAAQAVICRALEQAFPNDPIIGEEDAAELRSAENEGFLNRAREELEKIDLKASGDEICHWIDLGSVSQYSDRFWTLDPIDGTKGFLRGGQYAISLALIVNGRIEVAALGCPNLPRLNQTEDPPGVVFHAVRGQGTSEIPLENEPGELEIHVSPTSDATQARFCESVESGHSSHALSATVARHLGITREPLRLDSQTKYAVVARGEAEIYMRLPAKAGYKEKIWDHAGGVLVIEEAGGKVTDMTGKPLEFTHGQTLDANVGVIATNQLLHESVIQTLKEVSP